MNTEAVIVAAAVVRGQALLAAQRGYPAELVGKWELPGGRVERDEPDVDALRREIREELLTEITVGERVGQDVPLPGGSVLRVFAAALVNPSCEPVAVEHTRLRWVSAARIHSLDWLPGDRAVLGDLGELLDRPRPTES